MKKKSEMLIGLALFSVLILSVSVSATDWWNTSCSFRQCVSSTALTQTFLYLNNNSWSYNATANGMVCKYCTISGCESGFTYLANSTDQLPLLNASDITNGLGYSPYTVPDLNVVGWWTLDENNGVNGRVNDSSQYRTQAQQNGTNMAKWNTSGCIYGNCAQFNDTANARVELGNLSRYLMSPNWSIEAWANDGTTSSNYDEIFSCVEPNDAETQIRFEINSTGGLLIITYNTSGYVYAFGNFQMRGTGWHHVVWTKNATGHSSVYVDSILKNTMANTVPFNSKLNICAIGNSYAGVGWTSPFNGTIDNVIVYNRTLTQAEITDHYNNPVSFAVEETYSGGTSNPPAVSLSFPPDNNVNNSHSITFGYNPTGSYLSNCSLWLNNTLNVTNTTTIDNTTVNTLSTTIPDGSWYCNVQCCNSTGTCNSATSNRNLTIDTTPPIITDVANGTVTQTTAVITWTTDEASDSKIEYGGTTSYGTNTSLNSSLVTSHSETMSGLVQNTLYHYRVWSCDSVNNCNYSSDNTFTTNSIGWLTDYTKRKFFNVSVASGTRPIYYQLFYNITYDSDMQSDFDDLRFTDANLNHMKYCIEQKNNDVNAEVWIRFSDIVTTSNKTMVMFYGNSSVASASDCKAVFGGAWSDFNVTVPKLQALISTSSGTLVPADDAFWFNVSLGIYYPLIRPQAVFVPSRNQTFFVYLNGTGYDIYIQSYNHTSGVWSGGYFVGTNHGYANLQHGSPAIAIDKDGYIHVAYSAYASTPIYPPIDYNVSVSPWDITSWTQRGTIVANGGDPNYKSFIVVANTTVGLNDTIYEFSREDDWGTHEWWNISYSTDEGWTWHDSKFLQWSGDNNIGGYLYPIYDKKLNVIHIIIGKGHGCGLLTTTAYAYLNVTDGTWNTHSGALSVPFTIEQMELVHAVPDDYGHDYCRAFDFGFDENSNLYGVMRCSHPTGQCGGTSFWDLVAYKWNGSSWLTNLIPLEERHYVYPDMMHVYNSTYMKMYTTRQDRLRGGTLEVWESSDGLNYYFDKILSVSRVDNCQFAFNYSSWTPVDESIGLYCSQGGIYSTYPIREIANLGGYGLNIPLTTTDINNTVIYTRDGWDYDKTNSANNASFQSGLAQISSIVGGQGSTIYRSIPWSRNISIVADVNLITANNMTRFCFFNATFASTNSILAYSYCAEWFNNGNTQTAIVKYDGSGANTTLNATSDIGTEGMAFKSEFMWDSTGFVLLRDGIVILTATDTTYTTRTWAGVGVYSNQTSTIDNFYVRQYQSPEPIMIFTIDSSSGGDDTTPPSITINTPTNTTYTFSPIILNASISDASNVSIALYSLNGGANATLMNNYSIYSIISDYHLNDKNVFVIGNSTDCLVQSGNVFYRFNITSYVNPLYSPSNGCNENTNYNYHGYTTNSTNAINDIWILKFWPFSGVNWKIFHYNSTCDYIEDFNITGDEPDIVLSQRHFRGLAIVRGLVATTFWTINTTAGNALVSFDSSGNKLSEVQIDTLICNNKTYCDISTVDGVTFFSISTLDSILYRFNSSGTVTGRLNFSNYATATSHMFGVDALNSTDFIITQNSSSAGNIYRIVANWSTFEAKSIIPTYGGNNIVVFANDTLGNGNSSTVYFSYGNYSININLPVNGSTTGSDAFNFTFGGEVDTAKYSVDDEENVTNSTLETEWSGTFAELSDGNHNVTVWFNDSMGNSNSETAYWTRDTSLPSFSNYTIDPDPPRMTQPVRISVDLSKAPETVLLEFNNGTAKNYTVTTHSDLNYYFNISQGNYTHGMMNYKWFANLTTGGGNWSDGQSFTIGDGFNISLLDNSTGSPLSDWTVCFSNETEGQCFAGQNNPAFYEWYTISQGEINITFSDGSDTLYYFNNTYPRTNVYGSYENLSAVLQIKPDSTLSLSSNAGWSIDTDTYATIACTAAEGSILFKKDNITVSSPYISVFDAGSFVFSCSVNETENYAPASAMNTLYVSQLIKSCTSNSVFAFTAGITADGGLTTVDMSDFVADGYVKADLSDVHANVTDSWVNATGYYFTVNTTGISDFTLSFGNYYANYTHESGPAGSIVNISSYSQINPYVVYNILDELTGNELYPPDSMMATLIQCARGENYIEIGNGTVKLLIATLQPVSKALLRIKYMPELYYSRQFYPSLSNTTTINFYVVDAYKNPLDRIDFKMVDPVYYGSKLQVYKQIQNLSTIITEGYFDASHKISLYLMEDTDYYLRTINAYGALTEFGRMTIVQAEEKDLGKVSLNLNPQAILISENILMNAIKTGGTIYVTYDDKLNETEDVNVIVYFQNGTVFKNETFAGENSLFLTYNDIPENNTNESFTVKFTVNHQKLGNSPISYIISLLSSPYGFDLGISPVWYSLFSLGLLILVSGLGTRVNIIGGVTFTIITFLILIGIGWLSDMWALFTLIIILSIFAIIDYLNRGGG